MFLVLISGCAKLGPTTLKSERSNYNLAVQKTNDEQLLLNLARLKYRDTPFFMEVSSVASQFTLSTSANASSTLQEGVKGIFGLGGSVGVTEKPTVTYSPLQGDQFIQRVLSPLPLETITLLYHSGWSVERIFRLCFQRMNNLKNAPGASGPTPKKAPRFEKFIEATKYLRELQSGCIKYFLCKRKWYPKNYFKYCQRNKRSPRISLCFKCITKIYQGS